MAPHAPQTSQPAPCLPRPREWHGLHPGASPAALPNLLHKGDNLPLLRSLHDGPLRPFLDAAGGLNLIYMDPPFAVGADFSLRARAGVFHGRPLMLPAYTDTWEGGLGGFLSMMREHLALARECLAPDGCLFLHCDHRASAHLRLLLDDIFGPGRFLGELIWHYTGGGRSKRWFSRKHDTLFHYARSSRWTFNPDAVRVPYNPGSGYARGGIRGASGKRYLPHPDGTPVDDVWDIPMINPLSAERCGYPTQKPERLLERVIAAASRPGDLVADFFCGSATTAVTAERLGRRWLAADASPHAIAAARARLLALPHSAPFAVASPEAPPPPLPQKAHARLRAAFKGGAIEYVIGAPRLRCSPSGSGLRCELLGLDFNVPSPPPGLSLPPAWRDLLSAWSLAFTPGPAFAWQPDNDAFLSARVLFSASHCQKRGFTLCSGEIPRPDGGRRLLLVLTDLFANESRFFIDL